jgi:predicted MPP superfamily phosphohydrolase
MSGFALFSVAALILVVLAAGLLRSGLFALFAGVVLGLHTVVSVGIYPLVEGLGPLLWWAQAAVFVQYGMLVYPRLRPVWYRGLITVPGLWFSAGTLLAFPWAVAIALGFEPLGIVLPFAASAVGVWQSSTTVHEVVDLMLDRSPIQGLKRVERRTGVGESPLRLVQITDPHLGPFMSVARLAKIAQRAVDQHPDLVLLTGDFYTMEGKGTPGALAQALAPLKAMEGRVFACLGNHDHEALEQVAAELAAAGVRLLVDEAEIVQTGAGPVQVIGLDHVWRDRGPRHAATLAAWPRQQGVFRLVLLHDPGAFAHLPEGDADLTLSGHTHGGHVGLVSLGLAWTSVHAMTGLPDHGLWGHGTNRMYVHKGTGHYGFPLRIGVPAEESVLRVWPATT